jgi:hypothetical protein
LGLGLKAQDLGLRTLGLRLWAWGFRLRNLRCNALVWRVWNQGLGSELGRRMEGRRMEGLGRRMEGFERRVELRVQGLGFRV